MIDFIGEHCPQDRVAQMIVALIPSEIGEKMLDGVIDVLFWRNLLVIPIEQRLAVLLRAVLGDLRRCEQRMRRQEVESIRCRGLSSAIFVDLSQHIRLNAQDQAHHSSPSLSRSSSKHTALQDSM